MIYCNGKQNYGYNTVTILLSGHLSPVIHKNVKSENGLRLQMIFIFSLYCIFEKFFDTCVLLLNT